MCLCFCLNWEHWSGAVDGKIPKASYQTYQPARTNMAVHPNSLLLQFMFFPPFFFTPIFVPLCCSPLHFLPISGLSISFRSLVDLRSIGRPVGMDDGEGNKIAKVVSVGYPWVPLNLYCTLNAFYTRVLYCFVRVHYDGTPFRTGRYFPILYRKTTITCSTVLYLGTLGTVPSNLNIWNSFPAKTMYNDIRKSVGFQNQMARHTGTLHCNRRICTYDSIFTGMHYLYCTHRKRTHYTYKY